MINYQFKKKNIILAVSAVLMVAGCQNNRNTGGGYTQDEYSQNDYIPTIAIKMKSSSKSSAKGGVRFTENNGMILMEAKFSGLNPGPHAIHIHEYADCSAKDGSSAGGHWNPTNEQHGEWGSNFGYHKGDIGNFTANSNGLAVIEKETDQWCLGCGDVRMDLMGKSVVVHEGTDDFTSQPSGDAGFRIACGEIID